MKSEKSVEISKATLRLIWRLAQNIFPFHAALCAKLWVESGQLINWFLGCWDSRGRVLVVPFQKLSLKGILVKFCPIFSAFSVLIVKWESQYRATNLKDVWPTLTFFFKKPNSQTTGIPLRSSRRWGFPLSNGVSPYLLQMLTRAPLVTRSWEKTNVINTLKIL